MERDYRSILVEPVNGLGHGIEKAQVYCCVMHAGLKEDNTVIPPSADAINDGRAVQSTEVASVSRNGILVTMLPELSEWEQSI